jgi:hypothetical protein
MDHQDPSSMDALQSLPAVVKQEHVSRENTPFLLPSQSRHTTPVARPQTPVEPSSQDSATTVSTAPIPNTPLTKIEEDTPTTSPLNNNDSPVVAGSARRKKRKSRRAKATVIDTTNTSIEPPPPAMNLTHANKHWFDVFQNKQSSQSVSTVATEHHIRIEEQFNYVKEILQRTIGLVMLPIRWVLHCAAIYVLPFAIAVAFLAFLLYMVFPRYIFSAIPSILTTTTTILAFPARMVVMRTPEMWCSYIGLGCRRNGSEGEEVVRNATFATDLEVRNAFTVIHNLNYLNNSSNRLVLDSVITTEYS